VVALVEPLRRCLRRHLDVDGRRLRPRSHPSVVLARVASTGRRRNQQRPSGKGRELYGNRGAKRSARAEREMCRFFR
jgi:hypothetical protein